MKISFVYASLVVILFLCGMCNADVQQTKFNEPKQPFPGQQDSTQSSDKIANAAPITALLITDPEVLWRQKLVAGYFPGTELQKTNERPGDSRADAMVAIAGAFMPEYDAVALAQDLLFFVSRYDPIWTGSSLNKQNLDLMIARIKTLKVHKSIVSDWKTALTTFNSDDVNLFWTFGIVVDMPNLFTKSGFSIEESQKLLKRLSKLPPNAAELLAKTANIGKALAGGNLIQQDWLFTKETFDTTRFKGAVEALAKAIASR